MKNKDVFLLLSKLRESIAHIDSVMDEDWFTLATSDEISYKTNEHIMNALRRMGDDIAGFVMEQQHVDNSTSNYSHTRDYRNMVLETYNKFNEAIKEICVELGNITYKTYDVQYNSNTNCFGTPFEFIDKDLSLCMTYGSNKIQIIYHEYVPSIKGGKRKIVYLVDYLDTKTIAKILLSPAPKDDGDIPLEFEPFLQ